MTEYRKALQAKEKRERRDDLVDGILTSTFIFIVLVGLFIVPNIFG